MLADCGRVVVDVLAANVDLVLIATSLNRDLNLRRIERLIAVTTRGDVEALVLLTKSDLVDDPVARGVEGIAVSAVDGIAINDVRA